MSADGSELGTDDGRLAGLREMIPATGAGIYLDTATRGPLPAETAAAMRQADDWELTVGRAWEGRPEDVVQRDAEARAVLAALIGGDPEEIVLSHGQADGLRLARQQLGEAAELRHLVDPANGSVALRSAAHRAGRPLIVEATYAAGAAPLAVNELAADAFVFAADRWLLGPDGTGAVWFADRQVAAAAERREMGRTALVGLARSVGWLEMYVGLEWLHGRTAALAGRLHAALAGQPGIELLCPRESVAAIVSFRLPGWPVEEAADELSRRVHALVGTLPAAAVMRASVAWFNTEDEIDRFAAAVVELGRHTPASLPRRPPIVVLSDH